MINFEAHLLFYFDLTAEEGDLSTEQCPAVTWELQRDWILVVPASILVIKPFAPGFLSMCGDSWSGCPDSCVPPLPGSTTRYQTGRERVSSCQGGPKGGNK